jgi:hypothetical protein
MRAGSPGRRRLEDGVQRPDFAQQSQAGSPIKAITVWQPWASLIIVGAKPYEFRSWNPRERGPGYAAYIGQRHVIHAAKRKIDREEVRALIKRLEAGGDEAAATCLHAEKALPVLERAMEQWFNDGYGAKSLEGHGDLPWAAGLGTAVLGEPKNGFDVAAEFGLDMHVNDSDRAEHANWGWPMLNVEPWDVPVPMKGLQGFWGWPTPADAGL